MMRRHFALLALPVLTVPLFACSDDAPDAARADEYVCGPGPMGATTNAPTCSDDLAKDPNAAGAEAFRAHAVVASSVTGGVERFMAGALVGAGECFMRAVATALGDVLVGAVTGQARETPVSCDSVYDDSARAKFENGSYTIAARQRGGSPDAAGRMDTNAKATLKVYLARDAGDLRKGDLVTVDVQDPDRYLVHARVVVDASGKAAIAFDALGPLAPLLGVDAASPNPVPVTESMRNALATAFEIEGGIHAELGDCAGGYRSVIDQAIGRTPASRPIHPTLLGAVTTSPQGTQVTARVWDATYSGATGAPSGHIEVDVSGPGRVRHARIDLDDQQRDSASLALDCAP